MKTPANKEAPTPATTHPFFSHTGQGSFLSAANSMAQPFFPPNPGIQTPPARPQPIIQAKLTINQPGDPYEREADAMADRVMRMSSEPGSAYQDYTSPNPPVTAIQRSCSACAEDELVQRQELGATDGHTATPNLASQLSGSKGGGNPLPAQTLGFMNQAFGADFSNVRVHTGCAAAQMSQGIQAKAFTHGSDIYFNQSQYSPDSAEGKHLLGHELTHVLQQGSSNSHNIQRRELNVGLGWRLFNRRGNGDWYFPDRMQWQQASVGGTLRYLPQANTFILAAIYNTQNLRDYEYTNVEQRHDYYDLISYVIEHDPNTPAAARGVRFFHATTLVTGSPGIGTVDTPAGALMLRQDTRVILREVNAELFRANMRVIRNLLFNWREPRSPQNPQGRINAFDFDIQMVEMEQGLVEGYIQQNQARFTPAVVRDINDTMDPTAFGQSFNPSQRPFQWAIQALGVSALDFTIQAHRRAIGYATVHLFHRKTLQEYLAFMRSRAPQTAPRSTSP